MRPSHVSYAFLGSFLTAVFFLQWWQQSAYPWRVWLVLGLFGLFGILARRRFGFIFLSIIIGISIGLWTVARTTHMTTPQTMESRAGPEEIAMRGVIADDPERRVLVTNYVVEAAVITIGGRTLRTTGRVLVSVRAGHPRLDYGDEVTVRGVLEPPGERDGFDYGKYLSVQGVYSVMRDGLMDRTGSNRGYSVLKALYRLRRALEEEMNLLFTEPHASLLAGLLLGSKRGIPADLLNDFNVTGLTHIVAISGYNITMLVTVMATLLFWLPLKWRFVPSILIIIGFTVLTGASASAVRAAIMGILGLTAIQLNRLQTTRLTVLWSACLMLAWNPKLLWYDAGFQLSFLALLGVMEISPLLAPYFRWLPEHFGIRESLCLTVSAQMLASAWILFLFGQLSLIAPLSNLLVPPMVPYAMLVGIAATLCGWIWPPFGQIAAAVCWLPLQWIVGVTHILGSLPFAALTVNGISTVWIVVYYGCLMIWIVVKNEK